MYCKRCGSIMADDARFCSACGLQIGGPAAENSVKKGFAFGNAIGSAADKLYVATGGTGHAELRFKDFFTNVFGRHTAADTEELFACGSPSTTPPVSEVSNEWPRPWLYSRVFAVVLVTLFGSMALWELFENTKAFANIMFLGALVVPFSTLVFFFETNAWRNISIAKTVEMFFVGGILSILAIYPVSVLLPGSGAGPFIPAMLTGIIEEVAKIALVVFFMSRMRGRCYILNGLLIGAAVGAGFAVFETSGYVFDNFVAYFIQGAATGSDYYMYEFGYQGATSLVALRSALAIGGHVAWAAAEGAALAISEGENGFSFSQLADSRFLIVAAICISLHGIWDTAAVPLLDSIAIPLFGSPKYLFLIVSIWVVLAVMLNRGLDQVNQLSKASIDSSTQELVPEPC